MRAADDRRLINSIIRTPAIADLKVAHLSIEHRYSGGNVLYEDLQQFLTRSNPRFALFESRFRTFSICDVVSDLGKSLQSAVSIPDWTDSQRDIDVLALLCHAFRFI